MKAIRTISISIIVVLVSLLAIFQMDIRGYDKIERINAYVLYYSETYEPEDEEDYPGFLVKSGFEEMTLDQAFEDELFTNEEVIEILELIEEVLK